MIESDFPLQSAGDQHHTRIHHGTSHYSEGWVKIGRICDKVHIHVPQFQRVETGWEKKSHPDMTCHAGGVMRIFSSGFQYFVHLLYHSCFSEGWPFTPRAAFLAIHISLKWRKGETKVMVTGCQWKFDGLGISQNISGRGAVRASSWAPPSPWR